MTYIAFLRAVNVGGRFLKMDKLRELCQEIGLKDVRTYIQSGNIVFESNETDEKKLSHRIEEHLTKAVGFDIPASVKSLGDIQEMATTLPFADIKEDPNLRLFVMFLSDDPQKKLTLPYFTPNKDLQILYLKDRIMCGVCYLDAKGRMPNYLKHIEKELHVKATARFWHTLLKMIDFAKNDAAA